MKNIHVLPTDKPSKLATHYEKMRLIQTPDMWTYEFTKQNIYITNSEEIKEGDWVYSFWDKEIKKASKNIKDALFLKKIILTTDVDLIKDGVQAIEDEFLQWFVKNPSCDKVEVESKVIKDGVWTDLKGYVELPTTHSIIHKIIIPKEEQKQETFVNEKCFKCGRSQYSSRKPFCTDDFCNKNFYQKPKQETLEEVAKNYGWRIKRNSFSDKVKANELAESAKEDFIEGAKWQQERSYSEEDIEEYAEYCTNHVLTTQIGNPYLSIKEWFEQFKKK